MPLSHLSPAGPLEPLPCPLLSTLQEPSKRSRSFSGSGKSLGYECSAGLAQEHWQAAPLPTLLFCQQPGNPALLWSPPSIPVTSYSLSNAGLALTRHFQNKTCSRHECLPLSPSSSGHPCCSAPPALAFLPLARSRPPSPLAPLFSCHSCLATPQPQTTLSGQFQDHLAYSILGP